MDDQLQRRLRDADPLTAMDRHLPDTARLDAIKEGIMRSNDPVDAQTRPMAAPRTRALRRSIGLVAIGAASLALVLVVGSMAVPSTSALAWAAGPTAVTDAQKSAAERACQPDLTPPGDAVTRQFPAGAVPPPAPGAVPPLVSLELHGDGGVAILSDGTTTAYCLVKRDGDGFALVALTMPSGDGASVSVGGAESGTSMGEEVTGSVAGNGTIDVSAMSASFAGESLGIIGGATTPGAATVRIIGGPADGGTATVADGHFALWVPFALGSQPIDLVALDAGGGELGRVSLFGTPANRPDDRSTSVP